MPTDSQRSLTKLSRLYAICDLKLGKMLKVKAIIKLCYFDLKGWAHKFSLLHLHIRPCRQP
jgi:hypothetical protein